MKAGFCQLLAKIEEYLNRCFIKPRLIKLAMRADSVVAERKANKEYFTSF